MLRVDTAKENVQAFVDMMSTAVGIGPGRLGPWLETYFKLRYLEIMAAEVNAENKLKTEGLSEIHRLRVQHELDNAEEAEPEEDEADTSSTVPSQSAAPTAPPEGEPRAGAAKFSGNGARTKGEVHKRLLAARAAGLTYGEIAAACDSKQLTPQVIMNMASAGKVAFQFWVELGTALNKLGY